MQSLAAYQAQSVGNRLDSLPVKCGLPTISFALQHRRELTPTLQEDLMSLLDRPRLEKNIVAGHFRIHYDTSASSSDTPAMLDASHQRIPGTANEYADSVAAIANYVWNFETNGLGYLPPPPDQDGGGAEYDLYIQNLGSGLYGFTSPELQLDTKADGGTFTTYITLHNDFTFVNPPENRGLPALRVTIAHEFHHAIQIGNYGYWMNDRYFYEITSVWMEDVVYTDVNDYYAYLGIHFRNPDVTFTSSDFIMYGRCLWGHYVAKKFGRDVMRQCWEHVRTARPLQAIDEALHESPSFSSFKTAFAEWSLWNYFTGVRSDPDHYYPEGASYPLVTQDAIGFAPPSRVISGSIANLASKYYLTLSGTDSLTLIASNLDIVSAEEDLTGTHPYNYLLNANRIDDSYKVTGTGIFVKLDVSDPANWWSWEISKQGVTGPNLAATPFPDPFHAGGTENLTIPCAAPAPVNGSLSIFSSNMNLVYSWSGFSSTMFEKQVFQWNGITNDHQPASSGIYIYILELPDGVMKGKFAILRK